MTMALDAAELARRLARDAEAVCRCYLFNGRREGRYWLAGDVRNTPGRWQAASSFGLLRAQIMPAPTAVAEAAWRLERSGELWKAASRWTSTSNCRGRGAGAMPPPRRSRGGF